MYGDKIDCDNFIELQWNERKKRQEADNELKCKLRQCIWVTEQVIYVATYM